MLQYVTVWAADSEVEFSRDNVEIKISQPAQSRCAKLRSRIFQFYIFCACNQVLKNNETKEAQIYKNGFYKNFYDGPMHFKYYRP